ncbi:ejaculatory bulb-specific protein 1-like isoform X2 [Lineus longissimus]|uniref:ejaculatory bulb-specific protein 1-like isoform X2 n=1 Tax=Lineus longissimus TaxID=88925 RepID=UPI00315DC848
MASSTYSIQAVTTNIIAMLWIFLQGQAQAMTYTTCTSRSNNSFKTKIYCTNLFSTRCCYSKCCDRWDYYTTFRFSSCKSAYRRYDTCRNGLSTYCCRRRYGTYSTCCYSSTPWWQTSSTTDWWSTSSTTDWGSGRSNGPSLGAIIGGVFGSLVIMVIIVVVSVICCSQRSASRQGRVLGRGNTTIPMLAGAQPTTTTVTHHPYPAQQQPGAYPNQYPQGPYPYPQGGPSYPQQSLQGSAPYPPSTGVNGPPPPYDSALNMQTGSSMTELRAQNPSGTVPSAPYPQGPVGGAPYPTQPAGMPPPPPRY